MTTKNSQNSTGKKWKKTFQFLAAYLVAAWTFLEFLDWILSRYSLSPYWVDIFLTIFIGVIPSLLIYLYHRERINQRILRLREKVVFPLNLLLLLIVLYIGFGSADLGATTKSINYVTETGEQRTTLITKEAFRTGFYIYNFEPIPEDSTNAWLEFGISDLLFEDLIQNKNLSPEVLGITTTADKVKEASLFHNFYIDGDFTKTDSVYTVNTYIRNAKNSKIIYQETFEGPDIVDLIDEITVFVTSSFESKEINGPNYLDLDISEITSSNIEALKYFTYGDYENAIAEDSSFALAYLLEGRRKLNFSQGKIEERNLADMAYRYREKLPLQRRSEALVLKYLAYDQFDDAEQLVKLQLEVDPSSETYNRTLRNIYGRTKNLEEYTELGYQAWENEKNRITGMNQIDAGLIRGDSDDILKELNTFASITPDNEIIVALTFLPQLFNGDMDEARETLERIELLHPELELHTRSYKQALAYLDANEVTLEDLRKFEGEYRSTRGEQTSTFWVDNDILLQYVSNQDITPVVVGGEQTLFSGHPGLGRTTRKEFLKDSTDKFYAYVLHQYSYQDSVLVSYWKTDESILRAENLLTRKVLDSARIAYEKAIEANPNHFYLKNALAHINYVTGIDSLTLASQLREVSGTYSKEGAENPRKFWVQEGRLMYKREGLPSKELLPVSKTRYMSMSDFGTHLEFEYKDGKAIASYVWSFNPENMEWVENWGPEINYLLKD